MVPTKKRNVTSIYTEHRGTSLLVDCGEGTQRQLNIAGINRHRVKVILITHWHGDHVSGLMGMLQTMGNVPNPGTVHLIGPEGTKKHFYHLKKASASPIHFPIEVKEVKGDKQKVFEDKDVCVDAYELDHGVPCLGYVVKQRPKRRVDMRLLRQKGVSPGPHIGVLQKGEDIEYEGEVYSAEEYTYVEEGPKAGYLLDTAMCLGVRKVLDEVDMAVCEATFTEEHKDRAVKYKHMTAGEVAEAASKTSVKQVILTHFSQRYPDKNVLLEEAKAQFDNVVCAEDFMEVVLS